MTDQNGGRHKAWKDTLPQHQLEMVERAEGMPPEMALHYMWVDLDTKIAELQRPLWKQAVAPFTVAGAFVAGFLGPDFPWRGA